jgi:hypothetical protein
LQKLLALLCQLLSIADDLTAVAPSKNNITSLFEYATAWRLLMQRPQVGISEGALLILSGTDLPSGAKVLTTSYSHEWRMVEGKDDLDRRLHAAGWSLLFIANTLKASCLGVNDASLRKGINRLLKQIRALNLNSLRVTHIVSKKFIGIAYTSLIAHPCHIQQGCFLQAADKRKELINQRALKTTSAHALIVSDIKATGTNSCT